MAYTYCGASINGAVEAACGLQAGYTGRAIIVDKSELTYTTNANKPEQVLTLSVAATSKMNVNNIWQDAFSGAQTTEVADAGRPQWQNSLPVRIPVKNADGSRGAAFVKALASIPSVVIAEKEDGTYVIFGLYGKMLGGEVTKNETDNGGDWLQTLTSTESEPEVLLVDDASGTPIKTAKEKFQDLWDAA